MRKTTFLWLSLAVFCGTVLFHTSQKVTDGRAHLAGLQQDIQAEEESIRVLQAEWSYLNQPERLEKLAKEYLDLAPMSGRQFTKAKNLEQAPPRDAAATETVAEKTAAPAEKPAVKEKPVRTAAPKPKILKPVPSPAVAKTEDKPKITRKPEEPKTAQQEGRDFGDLMQSLGVQ